jgi:NarL family two-component system response regulator LiaR
LADRVNPQSIRVLVADDHAIVRKGICALLGTDPRIGVVAEAQDGAEAVSAALEWQPDVILMDLLMPRMDGLEAIRRIKAGWPQARILVLSSFSGDDRVFAAFQAGALGYLLKDSGPDELLEAIYATMRGESYLHPAIARALMQEISQPSEPDAGADSLTARERQVLLLIARGQSNREISETLSISEATVRSHVSRVLSKLKLSGRTQAALYALRKGLLLLETR